MSKTLQQIYALNPATTVNNTDLFYLVQSPYTPGTDAAITGADLKTAMGSGTVTSLSAGTGITLTPNPITTTGTIALTIPVTTADGGTGLISPTAHGILVGEGSSALNPIVLTNGQLLIGSTGADPVAATLTAGTNITITNAAGSITINSSNPGGTVTSISAGTGITLTPNPITTTGTVALTVPVTEILGGTNQTTYTLGDILYSSAANTLSKLAGNITTGKQYLSQTGTGVISAAPAWATISGGDITGAALTKTDDTNVTLTLGGSPTTALLRATSLTLGWTGQLAVGRGGTGAASFNTNGVVISGATTTTALSALSLTDGQLVIGSSTGAPLAATLTQGSGITITNGHNSISIATATGAGSPLTTKGDIYTFSTVNTRLPVGASDGQILQVLSAATTGLAWSTATYPVTAGTSGNVLTSDGTNWASSAPAASANVVITNDTTTNAAMFPTWVTANTGSLPLKVSSTKLSFNPSTAALTLTGSITGLTGKIDAPTAIASSTGLNVLTFGYTASAVNNLQVGNAVTTSAPALAAVGTDSNINIAIGPKSGNVHIVDSLSTVAPILKIFNAAGTHGTGLQVATAQATDATFTLPASDGSAGQPMITSGAGVLSFGAITAAGLVALGSSGVSHIGSFTRDMTTATGTQAVTGVGFTPSLVIFIAVNSPSISASWGFDNGTAHLGISSNAGGTSGAFGTAATSIAIIQSAANSYVGSISAFGADGFTISWTKGGSPSATMTVTYLAFK